MSEPKVGEPGYGVPADQLVPEGPREERPPLRNKPDPRQFLDPKRFARPPVRPPETRPNPPPSPIIVRPPKHKGTKEMSQ